jgi:DHA2 family multidrug resistance protein-like MFS transporter
MEPFEAGLWTLPAAAGVIAGGMALAPLIIERFGTAACVMTGLLLAAAGACSLTQLDGDTGLAYVVAGTSLINVGMGLIFTVTISVIVASAPAEQVGAASGLAETGTELGGALGIALLGSLLTAVYRGEVGPAVRGSARDSLAGAIDGAAQLPAGGLGIARDAFAQGLHVAAAVSVVVLVALAVVARLLLRDGDGPDAGGTTRDPRQFRGEPLEAIG